MDIDFLKEWGLKQFEEISKYPSEFHRRTFEVIIMEAFSQFWKPHSKDNQKNFVDFLIEYGGHNKDILSMICPTVLYYDNFEDDPSIELKLPKSGIIQVNSKAALKEANRLMNYLSKDKKEKVLTKYSYAGLIYQMRNKLVHEMVSVNMPAEFFGKSDIIPYMACENEIVEGKIVFKGWALNIPEEFILTVGKECINNYTNDCGQNNFSIDIDTRFNWYYKR